MRSTRTTTYAAMIALLSLAGLTACSGEGASDRSSEASDSGSADSGSTSGDGQSGDADFAELPADGVEIVGHGLAYRDFSADATVLVKITDAALIGHTLEIHVDYLDGKGDVIGNDFGYATVNWSEQQIAVTTWLDLDDVNGTIESISPRVELLDPKYGEDRGVDPLPILTDAEIRPDEEGLTVAFDVPEEARSDVSQQIGIVCFDMAGAIVGGENAFIDYDEDLDRIEETFPVTAQPDRCHGFMNYVWV